MISLYRYVRRKRTERTSHGPKNAGHKSHPSQHGIQPIDRKQDNHVPSSKNSTPETKAARKYMWKLNACLWLPFFLSSLDLTVVATALPYIASHFDAFDQLNWAVTSFTLTSTAFLPLFGQLADTFGRHSSLQLAISILTIGSIICAAAPVWAVFLLGRALQGLGTAGIQNVVMIILADKVNLHDQAKNMSIFQLLSGVGYSVGPVIGGYLTDASWRYCFVLPAGAGALSLVTVFLLRNDLVAGAVSVAHPHHSQTRLQALSEGLKVVDFGGAILFVASVALIILGTAWGGSSYSWNSVAVIAPLVIGGLLFPAFVFYEYLLEPGRLLSTLLSKTVPMIPVQVVRNKEVSLVSIVSAGTGAALYSVFYFIGIYFILAEGYKAGHAGVQLLYYVPGLGIGVYTAIFLVNKWPRQTFYPLALGTIIETSGIAALTYAVTARDQTLVKILLALAGVGTGLRFMPANLHLAGMFRERRAPAFSMLRFSLPFGGTLALTIMGAVFQNKMAIYFGALNSSQGDFNLHNTAALDAIASLPSAEQQRIRSSAANATMWAFVSILPFLGVSMLASFGLGNVWIPKKVIKSEVNAESQAEAQQVGTVADGGIVDRGVYLLGIFRGIRPRERVSSETELRDTNVESSRF